MKKTVSIITGCYNEEDNVAGLTKAVAAVFEKLPQYEYEHIFIDNSSTDETVSILREITKTGKHVRIIVNATSARYARLSTECFSAKAMLLYTLLPIFRIPRIDY